MGNTAVQQMLYLLNQAFDASGEHALLSNLNSVKDDEWRWVPAGGGRYIFDIVQHIGECKYSYDSHAFGDGSMRWNRPGSYPAVAPEQTPAEIIEWLKAGQRACTEPVQALDDDDELIPLRNAHWGEEYETRWLINTIIQHDLYHAGEINHIRSLRQETDKWAWQLDK